MAFGAPATPAMKPAGGAPPNAGAAASPTPSPTGKEPFGGSPASQPTPNAGYEAAVRQRVGVMIKQLQDAMQIVGASSEVGQNLLKMLNIAVKMVPAGTVSPAAEKNMLDQAQMRNTQNMQMSQQLKQSMAQKPGGQPGAGAPPPQGGA